MSKPDWAERLQRTFKRKYSEGFNAGYDSGYSEGFDTGSKKALQEAKKVFIKRINKELTSANETGNIDYVKGLNKAIELINRSK